MKSSVYLIVEAQRNTYARPNEETGLRPVKSVRVVGSRQGRPAKLAVDQVAVKVTIDIPNEIFDPITPSATVTIPVDLTMRRPVEVEAEDANSGEAFDE